MRENKRDFDAAAHEGEGGGECVASREELRRRSAELQASIEELRRQNALLSLEGLVDLFGFARSCEDYTVEELFAETSALIAKCCFAKDALSSRSLWAVPKGETHTEAAMTIEMLAVFFAAEDRANAHTYTHAHAHAQQAARIVATTAMVSAFRAALVVSEEGAPLAVKELCVADGHGERLQAFLAERVPSVREIVCAMERVVDGLRALCRRRERESTCRSEQMQYVQQLVLLVFAFLVHLLPSNEDDDDDELSASAAAAAAVSDKKKSKSKRKPIDLAAVAAAAKALRFERQSESKRKSESLRRRELAIPEEDLSAMPNKYTPIPVDASPALSLRTRTRTRSPLAVALFTDLFTAGLAVKYTSPDVDVFYSFVQPVRETRLFVLLCLLVCLGPAAVQEALRKDVFEEQKTSDSDRCVASDDNDSQRTEESYERDGGHIYTQRALERCWRMVESDGRFQRTPNGFFVNAELN